MNDDLSKRRDERRRREEAQRTQSGGVIAGSGAQVAVRFRCAACGEMSANFEWRDGGMRCDQCRGGA